MKFGRYVLKSIVLLGFVLVMTLGNLACKKTKQKATDNAIKNYTPTMLESLFEQLVLNKETIIQLAIDSTSTDITSKFSGYTFQLYKKTYYDGPFVCTANGTKYTGTWKCNGDYSQMLIDIHGLPELEFLNIYWRFKTKSTTKLEFVPWFSFNGSRTLVIVPK
jgi:hypothetical protein